ncbi:MAG: hypothetical protein R3208_16230 [Ketobacteraceae bacterium]|nr:hypothetical protein [Ketobacteraceae bacterium]
MRFMITGEHRRKTLLNTIILLFLGYVVLLWVSNALLFFRDMGLSYDLVVGYYLGNPEEFTNPRSFSGMLEVLHFHAFAMGILVLTLVHLMLFADISNGAKVFWLWVPFLFSIANEGAGWLVRFVAPEFAYFKIFTFLGVQFGLGGVVLITLWSIIFPSRRQRDA